MRRFGHEPYNYQDISCYVCNALDETEKRISELIGKEEYDKMKLDYEKKAFPMLYKLGEKK